MSNSNEDPSLERHFRGHKGTVTALAFNPSLKQLASSSLDNNLMIWNFRQAARAFRFMGHKDAVMDVCFSPSANLVASASKDRTVRLWVPTIQGQTADMRAHTGAVRSVDFSPDGKELLTSSDDKTVKLWSVARRKFLSSFTGHTNWVRCAKFSPDGSIIASCSDDKTIKLFDVQNSQCIHTFPETSGYALQVVFHPSGTCIGTAMSHNVVKVYDIRIHKLLQHYNSHDGPVNKIAFHPCGNFMISASQDSTMKVMDLLEGRPLYTLKGHEGPITAVTFSSNGEYFASGGADQKILVWRTNFDREEFLKESASKGKTTNIKEVQHELDAPGHCQVDARRTVIGSSSPDIDVTNVDSPETINLSNTSDEDVYDENVNQNGQKPPVESHKMYKHVPKPKPHSVHTVTSNPQTSAIEGARMNTQLRNDGVSTSRLESDLDVMAVVESLVQQVSLLKSTFEGVVSQQKLQQDKITQMDEKLMSMKSIIESMVDDSDESYVGVH